MKRIEITFQVIDDDTKQTMQQRSAFALENMDVVLDNEPLLAFAARKSARKFWESVVLMGYLEKS